MLTEGLGRETGVSARCWRVNAKSWFPPKLCFWLSPIGFVCVFSARGGCVLYLRLCTAVLAVLISPQVRAVARLCAIILLFVVVTKKIVEICQVDSGARKGTCRVEDTALL